MYSLFRQKYSFSCTQTYTLTSVLILVLNNVEIILKNDTHDMLPLIYFHTNIFTNR